MRTDMLMNKSHSDKIGASKRAPALTVVAAVALVFWFAVTSGTPFNSGSDMSTTPAFVQPAHESSSSESSFGRGSSIDDAVTSGVDAHG